MTLLAKEVCIVSFALLLLLRLVLLRCFIPLHHLLQGTSYMAEVSSWLRRHFAAKAVNDPAYANLRVSGCILLCVKGRLRKGKCGWEGAYNCHVVEKAHHTT